MNVMQYSIDHYKSAGCISLRTCKRYGTAIDTRHRAELLGCPIHRLYYSDDAVSVRPVSWSVD